VDEKWENFKEVANVEYDSGFGSPQVAEDLIIMGSDFWLERHEYDGSEWWEYKNYLNLQNRKKLKLLLWIKLKHLDIV